MMEPAVTYAMIRALSTPASLMMVTCQAAFRALLDLKTPLLVVIAAGMLNLILDPIFMFPMGMGIAGAHTDHPNRSTNIKQKHRYKYK